MGNYTDTRTRALRFLSRREYSEKELVWKLISVGINESDAEVEVARLKSENLVNDARFVQALLSVRKKRGYGPVKISRELAVRGVDETLIAEHVQFSSDSWYELVVEVARRKYLDKPVEDIHERGKRANFLKSRGFTSSHIKHALNN